MLEFSVVRADSITMNERYRDWTLITWDGNPDLNLKCWRKSFRRGHVSIGCGEFLTIIYSFGANSDDSGSSTRWRKEGTLSEDAAKALVDAADGRL